jgi:phosphoenolpyruvate carboxylase
MDDLRKGAAAARRKTAAKAAATSGKTTAKAALVNGKSTAKATLANGKAAKPAVANGKAAPKRVPSREVTTELVAVKARAPKAAHAAKAAEGADGEAGAHAVDESAALREDIRMLGRVLGDTIRTHEGADVYQTVEEVRQNAVRFRRFGDTAARAALAKKLNELDVEPAIAVVRAFSYF